MTGTDTGSPLETLAHRERRETSPGAYWYHSIDT